ncbi:MAG: Heparinase II/III-like protein [Paenibacillus sp.]|nr:Heparinase II/III-like protein [Paenibacillus sp.]
MSTRVKRRIAGLAIATVFAGVLPMHAPVETRAEARGGGSPIMLTELSEPEPANVYADKWIVAPYWTNSPVVDGELNEPLWDNAVTAEDFRTAYEEGTLAAPSVTYKMAYDNQYLYLGGTLDADEASSLARIEVVIVPPASERGVHYVAPLIVDPSDVSTGVTYWYRTIEESFINTGKRTVENAVYQIAADGGRVTIEAAIPLAAIDARGVSDGAQWRFNIAHIAKTNTLPLSAWIPIRQSERWDRGEGGTIQYHGDMIGEGRLGSLYFGKLPDPPVQQTAAHLEAAGWIPDNPLIRTTGYTEKELTFDRESWTAETASYRLEWKAPEEEWKETPITSADGTTSTYTLRFEHPAAKAYGLYQLRLTAVPDGASSGHTATLLVEREELIRSGLSVQPAMEPEVPSATVVWSPPSAAVLKTMSFIPDQPGYRYVGLPEMPELYPDALYTLSADGMSLVAPRTGTVYPNPAYPENGTIAAMGPTGQPVSIPYYEDAEGKRYPITAHLWYLQKIRAIGETAALAKTDPLGAARLLHRFAEKYRNYNPTVDQAWYYDSLERDAGPPYSYWGGMWYRWFGSDLSTLTPLLKAYADVRKTNAFEVLGAELGVDVDQMLREEMLQPSIDYVLSFPRRLGNLSYTNWNGMIEYAKALREPDYIHRVVESMETFMSGLFLSDGFWQEVSLSYHHDLINGIKSASDKLKGWSDPSGYVSPRTGKRLDNLDMEQDYPINGKALQMRSKLVYPDGKYYPINDTWAYTTVASPDTLDSLLLPSAGIGRLTGGEGADQTQLYMTFAPNYKSHYHFSPLNLNLFAAGQELLPDLGYTFNTFYRWFALSTMGHNTVVVNSRNSRAGGEARHGGSIEAFVSEGTGFSAMRASYEEAYAETELYSREPWFVPFRGGDGEQGYVLDLFRVSGGSRHEYTLQGDANRDASFATHLPVTEYGPYLLPEGTQVVHPTTNSDSGSAEGHYPGYIYVRDVEQVELPQDRYELTLHTSDATSERSKLHITGLLEEGANELYLGRSPSLRAARLNGRSYDNNDEAVKYTMPKMVHRREGTNLESTFVTVIEPYGAEQSSPRIEWSERLQPDQAPAGAVAVKIVYGDTTDLLLSNPDHPDQPLQIGDVTMYGQMGLIRLVNGAVREMSLVGGTLLSKGGVSITGAGRTTGVVDSTKRLADGDPFNAIITGTPVGPEAAGQYVVVTHPDGSTKGFRIGSVETDGGQHALVLPEEDPGFAILPDERSLQLTHPAKRWTGTHSFAIPDVRRQTGLQGTAETGTVTVTGYVYNPEGLPLAGAAVRLTGNASISAVTAADGSFALHGVPAGLQRVTAVKSGHVVTVSAAIAVTSGQNASVSVTMSGRLSPQLTMNPAVASRAGDPIQVTSTADGFVYIVPEGTERSVAAIGAAAVTVGGVVYGKSVSVTADVYAALDTAGMLPGSYVGYAIDAGGRISSGQAIWLTDDYRPFVDNTDPLVRKLGAWTESTSSNHYGGNSVQSRQPKDSIEIPFYGSGAKVLSLVGTSRGMADVYIDDVFQTRIDMYNSKVIYQHPVYSTGPLPPGPHVLRIVAAGQKRPEATGTFVSFDALAVTQP